MQSRFTHESESNDPVKDVGLMPDRRRSTASRLFFAVLLIVAGILLFLSNIGLLPIRNAWDYWPVILIVIGVAKLFEANGSARAGGSLLILFGALFLSSNLGLFHVRNDGTWILSMIFLGAGVFTLISILDPAHQPRRWWRAPRVNLTGPYERQVSSRRDDVAPEDLASDTAVFGSVKRRIETTNFEGGDIYCVLGSVELDLRLAQMNPDHRSATLQINVVLGAVKLHVPPNWRVSMRVVGVLGNAEDKTLPQIRQDSDTFLLVVTGQSVLAAVEVEN